MSEGRIIFQVTKVGMAANSRWKVFLDGKYVGDVDFKNDLQVETSKGKHSVQYKVGLQSTRVLDVEVADDDVMVECVFDGTVRNFHVIGGESIKDTPMKVDKEIYSSNNTNLTSSQIQKSGNGFAIILKLAVVIISIVALINVFSSIGGVGNVGKVSNDDIIAAAEKRVKGCVANGAAEVPVMTSEIIAQGDDWAMVLTRYKGDSGFVKGSYIVGVYVGSGSADAYSNKMKESWDYDLKLSESEIEVIKAQWEFE